MAYVLRFCNNLKKNRIDPKKGKLEVAELYEAEKVILKEIQLETLAEEKQIKLNTMKGDDGLIRVETRVSCRKDLETFRYPILLPNTHQLVKKLIMEKHIELEHAGTQTLMSNLRESYWIIKSRKTIRQVVRSCITCKRFSARPLETVSIPLPEDRENKKCWIVLFTCAIYRAVHLELITSLSTDSFILAFRRFIARRGRPTTIYSDNGKNFVGTFNVLNSIDWDKIQDFALKIKIQWKFSPPSAPWWGGFWERLVGMLKNVLRKVLGKASLNEEELNTLLCDAESIINSRPITYLSEDPKDLVALTPAMFLQEIREIGVPDFDMIDSKKLERRFIYRVKIRKDLRNRFRNEYLGLLKDYSKVRKEASVKDGDIVLIGDNDVKRINWPMAR
ncbi:integrase catalytic domain-containing protein [Trichonephila clavipes]|nr:integrase catalytic domain-containing protein [Trichonephila clavipes]